MCIEHDDPASPVAQVEKTIFKWRLHVDVAPFLSFLQICWRLCWHYRFRWDQVISLQTNSGRVCTITCQSCIWVTRSCPPLHLRVTPNAAEGLPSCCLSSPAQPSSVRPLAKDDTQSWRMATTIINADLPAGLLYTHFVRQLIRPAIVVWWWNLHGITIMASKTLPISALMGCGFPVQ